MAQQTDILVFGREGQLAKAFAGALPAGTKFLDRNEADFLQSATVIASLEKYKPRLVINCSAFTAVDLAESERDKSLQINAIAPGAIADWCAKNDCVFVHFSTDYVFSGNGAQPWVETDIPNPQNWYGQTKLLGEQAIVKACPKHLIFRISWVYSPTGTNFVKTMLRLGAEREELKIVSDQIGYPTYAGDVVQVLQKYVLPLVQKGQAAWGIYHLTGNEQTSWYEFAQEIFKQARELGLPLKVLQTLPITTAEYKTPAVRPLNSRMTGSLFEQTFKGKMPSWKQSLRHCLQQLRTGATS